MNIQTSNTPSFIQQNIPLADKNWFKTGGNAEYFLAPEEKKTLQEGLAWAKQNNLAVTIIGEGANILISDDGIKGLVINLQNKKMQIIDGRITIDAGVSMHDAIEYALKNNWGGLEDFGGIPGSVGGAVCMNIHYFNALLSDFIETVTVLDQESLEITEQPKSWCNFGYNKSIFLDKKQIVIAVTLRLKKLTLEETAYARGRHDEIVRQRSRRYPPAHNPAHASTTRASPPAAAGSARARGDRRPRAR